MAPKLTARERTVNAVKALGWVLDSTARVSSGRFGRETIQDSHAFLKPTGDADGSVWRLKLDYTNRSSYHYSQGNTLHSAVLIRLALGEDYNALGWEDKRGRELELKNTDKSSYSSTSWLFKVTSKAFEQHAHWIEKDRTLAERLLVLAERTNAIVWLAAEAEFAEKEQKRAEREEQRRVDNLKARPLPTTLDGGRHEGWNSDWKKLSGKLEWASKAIERADGTSDLPLLLADLQEKLNNVVAVLTPEARRQFHDYLGTHVLAAAGNE